MFKSLDSSFYNRVCEENHLQFPRVGEKYLKNNLYPHQKCEVWSMLNMENGNWKPELPSHIQALNYEVDTSNTSLAILGSPPGSGKCLTVLAHVLQNSLSGDYQDFGYIVQNVSYVNDNLHIKIKKKINEVNFSLLVIPNNSITLWKNQINAFVKENYLSRIAIYSTFDQKDKEDFQKRINREIITKLVVMKSSAFENFLDNGELFTSLKFQRFILDDAEFIKIRRFSTPYTQITWLISNDPENLRNTCKYYFPNNVSISQSIVDQMIVSSSPEFISESISIPDMIIENITTNYERMTRHGQNNTFNQIQNALRNQDIQSILEIMRCTIANDENSLISTSTENIKKSISSLNFAIDQMKRSVELYPNMEPHLSPVITQENQKKERLLQNIQFINNRIIETTICPISMEDIIHKTVTPCCHTVYELSSIIEALQFRSVCPLCRNHLTQDKLMVLKPDLFDEERFNRFLLGTQKKIDILINTIDTILQNDNNAKIVYYNTYDTELSFQEDVNSIKNRLQINFHDLFYEIKGNISMNEKIIRSFNTGKIIPKSKKVKPIKIIYVDTNKYAYALDFSKATHMITTHKYCDYQMKKITGLAQRNGRTYPLKIINIRYSRETN